MQNIASTLETVVARSLRRASDAPVLAWPIACGSAVAQRSRALEFRSGVLRVEVPDAGWRAELLHLVPRYLTAINKYSAVPVDRIEFVVAESKSEFRDAKQERKNVNENNGTKR